MSPPGLVELARRGTVAERKHRFKKAGRLTAGERQSLPRGDFALPGKGEGPKGAGAGSYPIPDESHAKDALARVSQHGTPEEKARVRAAVHRKFPGIKEGHPSDRRYGKMK